MPELRPGDIFCTVNPMWLGRAICAIESFWDMDGKAEYSHSGIILGPNGTTFEALWTNRRQGLFHAHGGKKVLIARHESMTGEAFAAGWAKVARLEGRWYAGHRLLLHLVPPLAKYIATGRYAVCSELAAKFLVGAGLLDHWKGVAPDYLAGIVRRWRGWKIVFEGALPATLEEFNTEVPHVEPGL
jgi:hypothetical protein